MQTNALALQFLTQSAILSGRIVASLYEHQTIPMRTLFFRMSVAPLLWLFIVAFNASAYPAHDGRLPGDGNTKPDLKSFFTAANFFFGKYTANGKVAYGQIAKNKTEIESLIVMIAEADLSNSDSNTKTAFYLNAYNLITIHSVVLSMPITSPLDVKGFFDTREHRVAGKLMTLNALENNLLRPDPRVHFALVCAANGCPKILSQAYLPDKVQAQLLTQTKKALNDNAFIQVDAASKTVAVSQIFEWYKDDFVKSGGTVISFINKFRSNAIPADYTISYYPYDWSLNNQ